ncbi:LysR substrate-binding domain-containing protein [Serratia marcescens]|uniref:LysR substrate-binding domain-containing protein n=1 Tax=Serratia marcescens TaxID=615 RepID=UPI00237FE186|nr:LysR substrate-binding domain-containing protein [Serratia marcescens]
MIMAIRENDFNRFDLNLIKVLMVLFRERSVSRAAEKLHLGQPAVSGILARLREMFNDQLFVRTAQGMEPTPRAEALVQALAPLMVEMQQALFQQPVFSPSHDKHIFRLGMADWVEMWLMPSLLALIKQRAPRVALNVIRIAPSQTEEMLESDHIDLALTVAPHGPRWLQRESLINMSFRTLWHPDQLDLPDVLSLADYVAQEHLLIPYRGINACVINHQLGEYGLKRTALYTTTNFAALPLILQSTPVLASVPTCQAAVWSRDYGLKYSKLPLTNPPSVNVEMLWHQRCSQESTLQWLLAQVREVSQHLCLSEEGACSPHR